MEKAATDGDTHALKRLIEAGGDVLEHDAFMATPLHWAASNGHQDCVNLLLQHGADVNIRDAEQQTPLHFCCRYFGTAEMVRLLASMRATVDAKDAKQKTPLHYACSSNKRECVKMLLDVGADVNGQSADGTTPRDAAQERGHTDLVQLLDTRGSQQQPMSGATVPCAIEAAPCAIEAAPPPASSTPTATAALITATAGADATLLRQALVDASAAGVDDAVLAAAVRRLTELQVEATKPSGQLTMWTLAASGLRVLSVSQWRLHVVAGALGCALIAARMRRQ